MVDDKYWEVDIFVLNGSINDYDYVVYCDVLVMIKVVSYLGSNRCGVDRVEWYDGIY